MLKSELESKIRSIKTRLEEIKQYKQVINAEGLAPDKDDKRRESELIVRLIRLERELAEKEGRVYQPKGRGGKPGKPQRPRPKSQRDADGKRDGKRAAFGKAKAKAPGGATPPKGKGPRPDAEKGARKDKDIGPSKGPRGGAADRAPAAKGPGKKGPDRGPARGPTKVKKRPIRNKNKGQKKKPRA